MIQTNVLLKNYIDMEFIPYQKSKGQKPINLNRSLRTIDIIKQYDIANLELSTINSNDIEVLLNQLKRDRNLSKASINRYRSAIMAIFSHAVKSRYINHNPVKNIKRAKERPRTKVLTYIEIEKLLNACALSSNDELYPVVRIALNTGMRLSEILYLTKQELKGNKIYLPAERTKSGYDHVIPLRQDIVHMLNNYIELHDNGERIFKSASIKRSFHTALSKASIDGCRFHDLRRTFASHMVENGTPVYIIKSLLGHSSITMTEHYLQVSDEKCLDYIEKLCLPT